MRAGLERARAVRANEFDAGGAADARRGCPAELRTAACGADLQSREACRTCTAALEASSSRESPRLRWQRTSTIVLQPRLSPPFSGRSSSNCTDALAPPSPVATRNVPASWNARRSISGALVSGTSFLNTCSSAAASSAVAARSGGGAAAAAGRGAAFSALAAGTSIRAAASASRRRAAQRVPACGVCYNRDKASRPAACRVCATTTAPRLEGLSLQLYQVRRITGMGLLAAQAWPWLAMHGRWAKRRRAGGPNRNRSTSEKACFRVLCISLRCTSLLQRRDLIRNKQL